MGGAGSRRRVPGVQVARGRTEGHGGGDEDDATSRGAVSQRPGGLKDLVHTAELNLKTTRCVWRPRFETGLLRMAGRKQHVYLATPPQRLTARETRRSSGALLSAPRGPSVPG